MLGKGKRFFLLEFFILCGFYKSYDFFPRSIFYSREWRKLKCFVTCKCIPKVKKVKKS